MVRSVAARRQRRTPLRGKWITAIADVTAATREPAQRAAMAAAEATYPMPAAAAARLVPRG